MILFFDKTDGSIIGTISGRVHSDQELKMTMSSDNLPPEKVGRFIVPFEPVFVEVEEPVEELVVVKNKVVKKITGTQIVRQGNGMVPKTRRNNFIDDFEKGNKSATDYKIKLNKKGELEDFELK